MSLEIAAEGDFFANSIWNCFELLKTKLFPSLKWIYIIMSFFSENAMVFSNNNDSLTS